MTTAIGQSVVVFVDEVSKIGDARRQSISLAEWAGFDSTARGKVALVVTEAASNLIKHGGGGEIVILWREHGPAGSCLEILTVDSGRGMSDIDRCVSDGYSSAGSAGQGLGAISRLADGFEIYSGHQTGTTLWARLHNKPAPGSDRDVGLEVGVVRAQAHGEAVCGDNWATIERDGRSFVLVVDGLGHGPAAAQAADEAVRVFVEHRALEPGRILESMHEALRGTRGAALAIARVDSASQKVQYAGVGNICGIILGESSIVSARMVSQNGIVGHTLRKVQEYEYPWNEQSLLIMHSDGLASRWSFDQYPGLYRRHPGLVAGVLYRDHKRGYDDVTVLAARTVRRDRS